MNALAHLWYNEMAFWLRLWKQSEDYGFLNECYSQILQQSIKPPLQRGQPSVFYEAGDFAALKNPPDVQKAHVGPLCKGGLIFLSPTKGFKLKDNRLYLPKLEWVNFFKSQAIIGTPKNVTVSKKGRHWYTSIQVEYETPKLIHASQTAIGIDLGIAKFATTGIQASLEWGNFHQSKSQKYEYSMSALQTHYKG